MVKEDNKGNGENEEGEKMPAIVEQTQISFADFITQNRDKIKKLADSNVTKNKNGIVVISKDDPWRNEHEWTEKFNKKRS